MSEDKITKRFERDGRIFLIKKFDAMTGLQIGRMLGSKMAILAKDDIDLTDSIVAILDSMNDDDVKSLVTKCLKTCSELLPAGATPVINSNGSYGIPDVEYDIILTLELCKEAIAWGASDFFDNSRFTALLETVGISLPNLPM